MSLYLGVTCKRCGRRFGKSLVGRSMYKVVACPYCGYRNVVKERPIALFSTADELRRWVERGSR
ncbi:MAG: hypothetical protein QXZ31_05480 [Thermofilaceae archaeon]